MLLLSFILSKYKTDISAMFGHTVPCVVIDRYAGGLEGVERGRGRVAMLDQCVRLVFHHPREWSAVTQ